MRFLFIAVAALLATTIAHAAVQWEPTKTHVLVASITKWPAKAGLGSFDSERRDEDLVRQFEAAGVPKKNIIFLKDDEATHTAIRNRLREMAARCEADGTLVFCFQGHGGRKIFYTYDYDPANADGTVFHMDDIYPTLETAWKGSRLFLIGDCCCSGSLRTVVRQFEEKKPAVRVAALASATASNVSTGNWTFTEGLIRILAGDPLVDRDRNGQITISEAERFLHDQMKYKEDQLAGLTLSASFEKDFVIRSTSGPAPKEIPGLYQIGDVLEAKDSKGKWYASEILDWKPDAGTYKVHYVGWDAKWDEWLGPANLRKIVKPKLNVGQQYEVLWQKKWYLATLTKGLEDYFYFVHYESEAGDDDEWITPERARPATKKDEHAAPQYSPVAAQTLAVGDVVAAQWHHEWYRAKITGMVNGTYAVRYDDESNGKLAADDMIMIGGPEKFQVGDHVLACWDNKPQMYPGKVVHVELPMITVRWEDGTAPTKVRANQVARIR